MDRRTLITSGLVSLAAPGLALAQQQPAQAPPPPNSQPSYPSSGPTGGTEPSTYDQDEIVRGVSDFLGVTAEAAGAAVERLFAENGRPTAYIAGEEGSGAFILGVRYGRGLLYMKDRQPIEVYWQGPSAGFDWGGNASRVFTLCYDLHVPEAIYQRFGGIDGSAYFIGGFGMTALTAGRSVRSISSGGWRVDNTASDHGRMARQRAVLAAACPPGAAVSATSITAR